MKVTVGEDAPGHERNRHKQSVPGWMKQVRRNAFPSHWFSCHDILRPSLAFSFDSLFFSPSLRFSPFSFRSCFSLISPFHLLSYHHFLSFLVDGLLLLFKLRHEEGEVGLRLLLLLPQGGDQSKSILSLTSAKSR